MTDVGRESGELQRRIVGIGAVVVLMVIGVLLWGPGILPGSGPPDFAGGPPVEPAEPIRAEKDVFRLEPGDLAAAPETERREEAHPRTMHMYRTLRAFPGAPPRVPHGLTGREFQGGRCNVCHRRGGYVERFAAYAPVTPHPELLDCLQCHVADDALVGRAFTDQALEEDVCLQCHLLDGSRPTGPELDWAPPPWPELDGATLPGAPPPIPHRSQFRENCLACHVGAGAMEAIRTPHAERANCRQCHVEVTDPAAEFTRPDPRRTGTRGDGP